MKEWLFCLLLLLVSYSCASSQESRLIKLDDSTEEGISNFRKSVPKDGWVLVELEQRTFLANYSNKDYIAYFLIRCKGGDKPRFLIEYSDDYADGDYGGIDFASSGSDGFEVIDFFIDNVRYRNPFDEKNSSSFSTFLDALKKSSSFDMVFYNFEFNPNLGKDELIINRKINFKSAFGELLDEVVDCN